MRQALADPRRRLAEMCARWADGASNRPSDLGPATGELARVVRYWRSDGQDALKLIREIDTALRLFADGDHALATEGHQLRLADLVSGDGPATLVIQMMPGREREASAPLVSALLAQLVAACAPSADLDQFGRIKQRNLLLVIEADALEALTAKAPSSTPELPAKKKTPLIDQVKALAHQRGLRLLVQARRIADAAALIRADDAAMLDDLGAAFAVLAAIGAQTNTSAKALSERTGSVEYWRRWPHQSGMVARWLLPYWERAMEWAVSPAALAPAQSCDGLLLFEGLKPVRCRALASAGGKSAFLTASACPQAPHDWDTPPAAKSKPVALVTPPPAQPALALTPNVANPVSGAKLRRALARRSAPDLHSSSTAQGERLI